VDAGTNSGGQEGGSIVEEESMSRIPMPEPLSLSPFLRSMHDGAQPNDWATRHVARAFAKNTDLLQRYLEFYYPFHTNAGVVEPRLKELVRLRIATLNGCKTCKAARLDPDHVTESEATVSVDSPDKSSFTPRERVALQLAETMATDHLAVDDRMIRDLRQHFSQEELIELMMMTGQYIGFGRMLSILKLEDATCSIQ
jgi:alkylhydroperoxidase family enzyme